MLRNRDYREATRILQQALPTAKASGEKDLAARLLANLGSSYFAQQQFQTALPVLMESEKLAASAGESELAAGICINISSVYIQMGDDASAAQWAERALQNRPGKDHPPKVYIQLASIRVRQGKPAEAMELFRKGIDAADRQGDQEAWAIGWDRVGETYFRLGQLAAAEEAMLESYRVRKLNRLAGLNSSYRNLGLLKLTQGDMRSAATLLAQAAEPSRGLMPEWVIRHAQGRLHMAEKNLVKARVELQEAVSLVRVWRQNAPAQDSTRMGMEQILQQTYSALVDTDNELFFQTGHASYAREAFQAAEENRAASLRLLLAEKVPTPGPSTAIPDLLEKTVGSLPSNSAYLGFHLGAEKSHVWAVDSTGFTVHSLPPKVQIGKLIDQFNEALRSGKTDATSLGRHLFQVLFDELPARFHGRSHWFLALDEELFRLPMAALVSGTIRGAPVYLIERHSLQIVSGAQLLFSAEKNGPPAHGAGTFVGVGDPIYNLADSRLPRQQGGAHLQTALADSGLADTLPRLAASGSEVESCARTWGSAAPVLLTGAAASRGQLIKALDMRRSVLHFAVHVVESTGRPRQGIIALSLDGTGRHERIGPAEIASWSVPVDIVVLSGCSSGVADALPGTGLLGLTRAWLASGAGSVIASRWATPDDNGMLFLEFYKNIIKIPQSGSAVALQQAQIEMRRSRTWRSDPRYWGAYFVMSNQ